MLLQTLEPPQSLSFEEATCLRTNITLGPLLKDHRERRMLAQAPAHRVGWVEFQKYGVLTPFGYDRDGFKVPNPFATAA